MAQDEEQNNGSGEQQNERQPLLSNHRDAGEGGDSRELISFSEADGESECHQNSCLHTLTAI